MELKQTLEIICQGDMNLEGRLAWGSNYTLLAYACADGVDVPVVYKPQRGERPLWDFPSGSLCKRERAAYLVSEAAGWNIVPPTILREGPYGLGSVQMFIEHDPELHYFAIQGDSRFDEQVKPFVLFDWVTNNADRKAGHVLIDEEESLWGIDHGICFHPEYKLRSVIWEFAGMPISAELQTSLRKLSENLGSQYDSEMRQLLSQEELDALHHRIDLLLANPIYPEPGPGRHYPWPPV